MSLADVVKMSAVLGAALKSLEKDANAATAALTQYRVGSDEYFAALRAQETGGSVAVDENGRPTEDEPTKPKPLLGLGAGVTTSVVKEAETRLRSAVEKAEESIAQSTVRYGMEMTDAMAKIVDTLSTKVAVFGATGDQFMSKIFQLLEAYKKAQDENRATDLERIQDVLYATVREINKWLGKEGRDFDITPLLSMLAVGVAKPRRSRLSVTSRGTTNTASTNTGTLP